MLPSYRIVRAEAQDRRPAWHGVTHVRAFDSFIQAIDTHVIAHEVRQQGEHSMEIGRDSGRGGGVRDADLGSVMRPANTPVNEHAAGVLFRKRCQWHWISPFAQGAPRVATV